MPRPPTRGVPRDAGSDYAVSYIELWIVRLALALFVAWVFANHHNAAVTTDDLALVADLLNAWLYLHDVPSVCCPRAQLLFGRYLHRLIYL